MRRCGYNFAYETRNNTYYRRADITTIILKIIVMEKKKNNRANLENKRTLFLELGLMTALAVVLFSFEWGSSDINTEALNMNSSYIVDIETIPITTAEMPPPPEVIKEPVLSETLEIVENNIEVTDIFINSDDNEAPVKIVPYVADKPVEEDEVDDAPIPYAAVQEKPTFMDRDANEFTKWVYANMEYPDAAKENGVQGRVTLEFTIDKSGRVSNIKILRGVDPVLDNEAVRVISKSPKWSPGKNRGKAVDVKYTFPIVFQLR